jgi:hypothetical protein
MSRYWLLSVATIALTGVTPLHAQKHTVTHQVTQPPVLADTVAPFRERWRQLLGLTPPRPMVTFKHIDSLRMTRCPMPVSVPDTSRIERMPVDRRDSSAPAAMPTDRRSCVNPLFRPR